MKAPFLRTPYNYDMNQAGDESGIKCTAEEGKAQQQFRDETDINTIVRRFGLTGELPDNPNPPQYGDFTGINDFHTAQNAVRAAQEGFDQFPAEIRARFHNDPQEMLEFLDDANNKAEALKIGLINAPPEVVKPPADPLPQ